MRNTSCEGLFTANMSGSITTGSPSPSGTRVMPTLSSPPATLSKRPVTMKFRPGVIEPSTACVAASSTPEMYMPELLSPRMFTDVSAIASRSSLSCVKDT